MAKSFKGVVLDTPRTGLGISFKTKYPVSRIHTPPAEPPFGLWLVPVFRYSFARESHPRPHAR